MTRPRGKVLGGRWGTCASQHGVPRPRNAEAEAPARARELFFQPRPRPQVTGPPIYSNYAAQNCRAGSSCTPTGHTQRRTAKLEGRESLPYNVVALMFNGSNSPQGGHWSYENLLLH